MGATEKGLPYPEPTSFVRDGASAMRALAEAVDAALGGALFRATVTTEAIANNTDDRLELNLTVDDSPLWENNDGNLITYTGPPAVVLLAAQVTWEGDAAGTRRIKFIVNGADEGISRVTPDSQAITMGLVWTGVLDPGDKVGLVAFQTSGSALDVTSAKFRCVVLGVAP